VREQVRQDFGVELVSIEPVLHGADEAAQLWHAVDAAGARYAVKLTGGGTAAGLAVTAHLARHGTPGIAAPLRTHDDRPFADHDGRRLSVAPWVSDQRALDEPMTAAHWTGFGRLLARAHSTAPTGELAGLLPHEQHTHPRATAVVHDVRRGLAEPGEDHLVRDLALFWRQHADAIGAVLDHADRLGERLRGGQHPEVICHADPHLGNLLLGPDGQVWLIDWDDAVLAPPERDLMFVVGGVLAFAPVTAQDQAAFFTGYGPAEIDPGRLAYYMCVRALEDLDFALHVLDVTRPEADRAWALSIVRGCLSPTGLVSLAKTAADEPA
jgi:spectinomycin phosphotransferase